MKYAREGAWLQAVRPSRPWFGSSIPEFRPVTCQLSTRKWATIASHAGVFRLLTSKIGVPSQFEIEMWPIDRPIDYPKNARKWADKAIAKVAASIKAFGFQQPLVVDSQGVIVIGHLRRVAARTLGITEVPVHVARDLSAIAISRGHYHWAHEPCWYAVRAGSTAAWVGDRKQSTRWDIDKPMASETGHSTQKPVECMRRPMLNHDAPEVYDPFLGSGTTIIAAESVGRRCFGLELEPKYCDVIVKRWENLTGKKAVLDAGR